MLVHSGESEGLAKEFAGATRPSGEAYEITNRWRRTLCGIACAWVRPLFG